MMTSSNGNIFRVTGLLCGEFTGHGWIPRTKASGAELWCFLWSAPETNSWANNGDAGDLRRYRAQYDVFVVDIVCIRYENCNVPKPKQTATKRMHIILEMLRYHTIVGYDGGMLKWRKWINFQSPSFSNISDASGSDT